MREHHERPDVQQQIPIPEPVRARDRHSPTDLSSYRTQVVRAEWLPGAPDLAPITDLVQIEDEPSPGDGSWFVVSAWNPDGAPTTLEENLERHEWLTRRLLEDGGRFRESAAWAPDRRWAEQTVAVQDGERARRIAELVRAPAYVEYDGIAARIWRTGHGPQERYAVLAVPRRTGCPMLLLAAPDERCVPQGGPWVSASRARAAAWHAHRNLLEAVLGCECRPGEIRTSARYVGDVSASSRWGDPLAYTRDRG